MYHHVCTTFISNRIGTLTAVAKPTLCCFARMEGIYDKRLLFQGCKTISTTSLHICRHYTFVYRLVLRHVSANRIILERVTFGRLHTFSPNLCPMLVPNPAEDAIFTCYLFQGYVATVRDYFE